MYLRKALSETENSIPEHLVLICEMQSAPLDDEDGVGSKTPGFQLSQFRTDEQNSLARDDEGQEGSHVSKLSEVATSSILLKRSHLVRSKIAKLRIPSTNDTTEEEFKTPQTPPEKILDIENYQQFSTDEDDEGFETAEDSLLSEDDFMYPKLNLFEIYGYRESDEPISHATILKRIHSHKRTKSYQLGEHLQLKWTTGAGPRIGCVRDYPSRLQFQVLEHVQLSPRKRHYSLSASESSAHKHITVSKSCLGQTCDMSITPMDD